MVMKMQISTWARGGGDGAVGIRWRKGIRWRGVYPRCPESQSPEVEGERYSSCGILVGKGE